MTLNQLLSETYALGFEDTIELTPAFIFAANRALRQISTEHADERCASIFIPKPDINYSLEAYDCKPSGEFTVKLSGASAFSTRVYGSCTLCITDSRGTNVKELNTPYSEVREFLSGEEATLVFFSNTAFSILRLCAFASLRGTQRCDIPILKDFTEFYIKDFIPDFLLAIKAPYGKDKISVPGASVKGGILALPSSFSGEIFISYKPLPTALSEDSLSDEVDIPERCKHLLPILTAAYIWLDDEEEKADYYMQIYRDESARLKYSAAAAIDPEYSDVTGWA